MINKGKHGKSQKSHWAEPRHTAGTRYKADAHSAFSQDLFKGQSSRNLRAAKQSEDSDKTVCPFNPGAS